MAISESTINEIKYRNDIESVVSSYVTLKRRGKNLIGLCPFHNEKTPSFTVYPESGSFYCFGCGAGGDVFTFTKLIENLDYIDAVRLLAERSGISVSEENFDNSLSKLKEKIYEINRETAKFFHEYLMSDAGKWALDYFRDRGLKPATIKHFGLGAAPDSWDNLITHLKSKGFSLSDMLAANVIVKSRKGSYYDRFRKRVMFPIIDIRGRVIAFSGRAMPGDTSGGKYVNTADTPVYKKSENLFGMNFAKSHCSESVILVEGNMDVISLHQSGFQNAVAALGTSFTNEQAKLLSRYTKEIILTLDADAAGMKAAARAGDILKNTGLKVRVVSVPDGKDPDEFIKKHGAARFSAVLDGAVNEIEYKLLTAVGDIDVNSDDGKVKYVNRAAEIISESADAVERDVYIGRLSKKYDISRTALTSRVEQLRKTNARKDRKKAINSIIRPKFDTNAPNPEKRLHPSAAAAEESVISVLFSHPDYFEEAYKRLKPEQMITAINARIYRIICDVLGSGKTLDISDFSEILSDGQMGYLVSIINSEKGRENPLIVLKDSISVILDEGNKKSAADIKNMDVDEWAENLKKVIENKKRGKKE
ncbi:MAG: DNA primase [Clostridia bacterium]|nr:DNA primase [Clostridia bacterium]